MTDLESTGGDAQHTQAPPPSTDDTAGGDGVARSEQLARGRGLRLRPRRNSTPATAAREIRGTSAATQPTDDPASTAKDRPWRRRLRTTGLGIVSVAAMLAAVAAAYLKYQYAQDTYATRASIESVQAAKGATVALLSYNPQDAQPKLTAAADLLTGTFRDSYTSLTRDVVIPGAQQEQISATATVAAAASLSATDNNAVVIVFINQTVIMANDAPTQTSSVIEVTLQKHENHWLISGFDPK